MVMDTSHSNPTVSIIIPTLNSERVLGKCLDSIFSQDYARESVEIIVVDGGSQDNTLSIVKAFSKRKTRIMVYNSFA